LKKLKFHIKVIWVSIIARNLLGLLGLFVYPFINKEKARKNRNFWWFMLNDDELGKNGDKDYNVEMVEHKGITKWFASYWFNAIRNRAYNWLQYKYYPKLDVDNYRLISGTKEAMEWQGGWAWFYPNPYTNVISARYSKQIFGKTFKYGDFGDRYDMIYK